jgi:hypothetical protein
MLTGEERLEIQLIIGRLRALLVADIRPLGAHPALGAPYGSEVKPIRAIEKHLARAPSSTIDDEETTGGCPGPQDVAGTKPCLICAKPISGSIYNPNYYCEDCKPKPDSFTLECLICNEWFNGETAKQLYCPPCARKKVGS